VVLVFVNMQLQLDLGNVPVILGAGQNRGRPGGYKRLDVNNHEHIPTPVSIASYNLHVGVGDGFHFCTLSSTVVPSPELVETNEKTKPTAVNGVKPAYAS
jgi:hypothetical protein